MKILKGREEKRDCLGTLGAEESAQQWVQGCVVVYFPLIYPRKGSRGIGNLERPTSIDKKSHKKNLFLRTKGPTQEDRKFLEKKNHSTPKNTMWKPMASPLSHQQSTRGAA